MCAYALLVSYNFFYNSDRINPRIYQGRNGGMRLFLAATIFLSKTRLNPLYTWLAKKIARAFSGANFGGNFGGNMTTDMSTDMSADDFASFSDIYAVCR